MGETMFRRVLAATLIAGAPAVASAQSASAPLIVTATVVSSCRVNVPRVVDPEMFPVLPVAVACARRGGAAARVQRPIEARRSEMRDAVLLINF
jgi:hypothetical protein